MKRHHPDRLYWLGDEGDQVAALQRALMAQGYRLPNGGADGTLGPETWKALQRYAEDRQNWRPRLPSWVAPALLGASPAPPCKVARSGYATAPLILTSPKTRAK